ncbi:MAG: hypothetical protein C0390_01440 [Syntrophus sp. (in: bacteria)]|nr:hypothetical protein [Syntrophus sp. (in: bacteria)]
MLVWTLLVISYMAVASCVGSPSKFFDRQQINAPQERDENGYALSLFIGAALIILGAKFTLIHYYGSDLPFWDQWDTEPKLLYIPYDQGKLSWSTLFSPHNEHRIFFSRLWALTLYAINQQWDAHLQTVANAFLHTFFGLWLVWILWRLNDRRDLWIIAGVFVLILAVPFSWENTLFGFQSSFYFLLGFSSMAILLISQSRPFSTSWMMGIFFAVLSLFTMGAGFFVAPVSLALTIIRAYRERRMTWRDGITLISCLLILLAGILLIHVPEGHAGLRPNSFSDFMTALGKNLSWPWIDVPLLFLILWCPFVILSYRTGIGKKEKLSGYPLFIMGLGLWTLLQCIAMAYSRGFEGSGPASRYMDSLSLIPVVNILAAHYLYSHSSASFKRRKGFVIACSFWYAFSVIGFLNLLINESIEGFSNMGSSLAKQSETVSRYLASENDNVILMARHMEIPYPDAKRLTSLLRDDAIRKILPVSVRKPLAFVPSVSDRNDFVKNGFYSAMPVIKDRNVWGSYVTSKGDRNTGYLRSERMPPPRLPYLRFRIAGYLDNSRLKLDLYDMDHQLIEAVVPKRLPKESWMSVDIKSPRVPFYIKATDQTKEHRGWFAFSEPTEIGLFSIISESIRSAGRALLVMGLAIVLGVIIYAHLQKKEEIPYHSTEGYNEK